MTELQKLQLRQSEVKQKIKEFSELKTDEITDEKRGEFDQLKKEHDANELRYQALLITAQENENVDPQDEPTGEGKEVRQLIKKSKLDTYLDCEFHGRKLDGAELELNEAITENRATEGGTVIPLEMFIDEQQEQIEKRAATTTTQISGEDKYRMPIGQKLWGTEQSALLNVTHNTVMDSNQTFLLLTEGGRDPEQLAEEGALSDSQAATINTIELAPRRLSVERQITGELMKTLPQIVPALRINAMRAMRDEMQDQIFNGDSSANPTTDVTGFMQRLAAPATPNQVITYEALLGILAPMVDGVVADTTKSISVLLHKDVNTKAGNLYQAASGMPAIRDLEERSKMVRVGSHLPATASNTNKSNILYADGGRVNDSPCVTWGNSIEVLYDPYSNANKAVKSYFYYMFWNFYAAHRNESETVYKRFAVKIA